MKTKMLIFFGIMAVTIVMAGYFTDFYRNNPSVVSNWLRYGTGLALTLVCIFMGKQFIESAEYRYILYTVGGIVGFGLICNAVVVTANNGYMPVAPDIYDTVESIPIYYIRGGGLLFLGDCYFGGASVGDLFLYSGFVVFIILVSIVAVNQKIKRKST